MPVVVTGVSATASVGSVVLWSAVPEAQSAGWVVITG